jgi:hypothetical protein
MGGRAYYVDPSTRQSTSGGGEEWQEPGPYTGRGPKGYTRSEERIKEEICERLMRHGSIDAREIDIEVAGGVVTLKGSVASRAAKHAAEDTAESVLGVVDIQNLLRVDPGAFEPSGVTPGERAPAWAEGQRIIEGMEVVDSNGEHIGHVKEIREKDFLVDRTMTRDVYIPFSVVAQSGKRVVLKIDSAKMKDLNLERPSFMGSREPRNVWPD